jgi:Arc/MetJ-type ribon-helix-helix transcriptional regulator
MSESRRTNITISETLYAKAQEMMKKRDFTDFSGYLQQLIREDWERRHHDQVIVGLNEHGQLQSLRAPPASERAVVYPPPKRKKK